MFTFWLPFALAFPFLAAHDAISSSPRLVCNETYICTESDRKIWLIRRDTANKINQLIMLARQGGFVNKADLQILAFRDDFCADTHTAGFLFDAESETWPIACLSSGSDGNGTCAPAPVFNSHFDFISGAEWGRKVREARVKLGCSMNEIRTASNDFPELFVCRERCTHAGIGYFQSLLIIFTIIMTTVAFTTE